MLIGYARVSTADQELRLQLDALTKVGCEKIFTDKASGSRHDRPGLAEALEYVRPGDCLVIWKLDRLGRDTKGLIDLAGTLTERQVDLRSVTEGIETNTAVGRFFFHTLAALATMERELMLERTRAGLEAAKRAGRVGGRRRSMTDSKLAAAATLKGANVPMKEIAQTLGVSLATLYRYLPASMAPHTKSTMAEA